MQVKLEITISVIIQATEDMGKFFRTFEEIFDIKEEQFSTQNLTGHFGNPINIISTKIIKKPAHNLLRKIVSKIPSREMKDLLTDINYYLKDSSLHLRFDKQKFLSGGLTFENTDSIKIKIFTPVYRKNQVVKSFTKLLDLTN